MFEVSPKYKETQIILFNYIQLYMEKIKLEGLEIPSIVTIKPTNVEIKFLNDKINIIKYNNFTKNLAENLKSHDNFEYKADNLYDKYNYKDIRGDEYAMDVKHSGEVWRKRKLKKDDNLALNNSFNPNKKFIQQKMSESPMQSPRSNMSHSNYFTNYFNKNTGSQHLNTTNAKILADEEKINQELNQLKKINMRKKLANCVERLTTGHDKRDISVSQIYQSKNQMVCKTEESCNFGDISAINNSDMIQSPAIKNNLSQRFISNHDIYECPTGKTPKKTIKFELPSSSVYDIRER